MFKNMGSVFHGGREGKGFYIVLGLCALVVGTSSWILLQGAGTDVEDAENPEAVAVMQIEPWEPVEEALPVISQPMATPAPTAAPTAPAAEGFSWPVDGPLVRGHSGQSLQYDATMSDWRSHEGLDIACGEGSPVMAAAGGTVVEVWEDPMLGVCLELEHGEGINTIYANLAPEPAVSAGQWVNRGQLLGHVGSTALGEAAEDSHLHFAMTSYGETVDPENYLR